MLPQLVLRHWFGSASRSPAYAAWWKAILIRVGGRARTRLFICAGPTLYAIYTYQRGAQRP